MAWVDTGSGGDGGPLVGLGLRGWGKCNFGIEIQGNEEIEKGESMRMGKRGRIGRKLLTNRVRARADVIM